MIQDKAQSAGNGHVLYKDCNAVLDHLGNSESFNITLLDHQIDFLDHLGNSESFNITLLDHQIDFRFAGSFCLSKPAMRGIKPTLRFPSNCKKEFAGPEYTFVHR